MGAFDLIIFKSFMPNVVRDLYWYVLDRRCVDFIDKTIAQKCKSNLKWIVFVEKVVASVQSLNLPW